MQANVIIFFLFFCSKSVKLFLIFSLPICLVLSRVIIDQVAFDELDRSIVEILINIGADNGLKF